MPEAACPDLVRRDHEHAVAIFIGDVNDVQVTPRGGLAQRMARTITPGPILARVLQDVLNLGLGYPMPVDVPEEGVGVDVVAEVHERTPRGQSSQRLPYQIARMAASLRYVTAQPSEPGRRADVGFQAPMFPPTPRLPLIPVQPLASPPQSPPPRRLPSRASDQGSLSIQVKHYIMLVDWTGRGEGNWDALRIDVDSCASDLIDSSTILEITCSGSPTKKNLGTSGRSWLSCASA